MPPHDRISEHFAGDPAGHLREIEWRLRQVERQAREIEEWRLGCLAMIDAIPELRKTVEQAERADAIANGVTEALRGAQVRGWGKVERRLALLGGAGIVVSLALNVIQTFWR